MREVVIIDGIRTSLGRAGREQAYFKDVRGDDLGTACIKRLLERSPALNPAEIEDVVWGCDEETKGQESSCRSSGQVRRTRPQRNKQRANKENGRKGGLVKSRKKTAAARRNARRPRSGRRKKPSIS